jgi:predicted site-specific integrase-resolvase
MLKKQVPDNLLTLEQVSELPNVHTDTLLRWCNERKIHSLRITARGDPRFREEKISRTISLS